MALPTDGALKLALRSDRPPRVLLLDPQVARELGIVAANLLDEALRPRTG